MQTTDVVEDACLFIAQVLTCHRFTGGVVIPIVGGLGARGVGAGLIRGSKVSAGVGVEVGAVGGGEL